MLQASNYKLEPVRPLRGDDSIFNRFPGNYTRDRAWNNFASSDP